MATFRPHDHVWHKGISLALPCVTENRAVTATVADGLSWVLMFETALTNVSGAPLAFGSPTTTGRAALAAPPLLPAVLSS
ncbi:hypothetical protein GCM10009557_40800 [Virgisporangium ochraceum]|uniref:Uncharacterized protein n=1 Tax=Virgisporangium ochraceum TaxID=65505 RepID=A0A8J4EDW2_9ACTN|nr:hypothetical protein Voc01_060110 [Virgisporangium ochraceum]